MTHSPFITSLTNHTLFSDIIKHSDVELKNAAKMISEPIDNMYSIKKLTMDQYVFESVTITVSKQKTSEFLNPVLAFKFISQDIALFDNSDYHFGKKSTAFEIPTETPSYVKEWRKKMGGFLVFDKKVKIKLSKFSNGICVVSMLVFEPLTN